MGVYAGQRNYGDIFQVPTSAVDNISAKLYAEHKMREAKQAQDLQGLDNMFAKNVAGVRDEDVPEISDAYSKYKASKIDLYRNKLTGKDRIAAEMDAQRNLANVFAGINDSKQTKNQLENNAKIVAANPNDHLDNAATIISMTNGIPTSKLKEMGGVQIPTQEIDPATGKPKANIVNPLDINALQDRGNVQDWMPIIQKAVGIPKAKNTLSEDYKDENGTVLGQKVTPIKAVNSPVDYYNYMGAAMAGTGRSNHFNKTFTPAYSDEKANAIIQNYEQLKSDPVAVKAWGQDGLDIPPTALLNPATRTLALNSMAMALANKPTLGTPSNVPNIAAVISSKNSQQDKMQQERERFNQLMQDRRENAAMRRLQYAHGKSSEELTKNVDGFLSDMVANGEPVNITGAFVPKELEVPQGSVKLKLGPLTESFHYTDEKGKKFSPTDVYHLPNGNYKLMGNGLNTEITPDAAKALLVKNTFPTRAQQNQINTNRTIPGKKTTETTSHSLIETKGKTGKKIYIPK